MSINVSFGNAVCLVMMLGSNSDAAEHLLHDLLDCQSTNAADTDI